MTRSIVTEYMRNRFLLGAGGTPITGGGTTGVGGTTTSNGGTTSGTGGSMGGTTGSAGGGSGVQLVDCVQSNETSAKPITDPCGTFLATPSYATKLQLGPYGGQMDVNVGKGFENPDP